MTKLLRPNSCPVEGQIEAYDAGWNAFEVGLDRSTVLALAQPSAKAWAVLGYDTASLVAENEKNC